MNDEHWTHPRVRELVAQARRAEQMRDQSLVDGGGLGEIDQVLAELYRDIGRVVVELASEAQGPAVQGPLSAPTPDELPEEDDDSWYTDEVPVSLAPGPMFDAGELDEATDVPEPDLPLFDPVQEPEPTDPAGRFVVATTAVWAVHLGPLLNHPAGERPTWRHQLDELLDLLHPPGALEDEAELAVEVSRVQWAANELQARLTGLPEEIQVALVALLGARAQHLRTRLARDVGPRLSLDRLHRYRIDEDLPVVPALLPSPRPEAATWDEDTRAWWSLLRPGRS